MFKLSRCDTCAVRQHSVCSALSPVEIAQLNAIASHKLLPRGSTILHAGAEPEFFANIISGVVKLGRDEEDGRRVIVGLQFASDFIGRPVRRQSAFEVIAVTDVQLCLFPVRPFEALVQRFPRLGLHLFERTLDELDAAREWMAVIGHYSARDKVAALLGLISDRHENAKCGQRTNDASAFELPLSREEIAEFLGLTVETVSRQMSQMKREGVIALPDPRDVLVLDHEKLRPWAA